VKTTPSTASQQSYYSPALAFTPSGRQQSTQQTQAPQQQQTTGSVPSADQVRVIDRIKTKRSSHNTVYLLLHLAPVASGVERVRQRCIFSYLKRSRTY
jgi:hypothetical protein